VEELLLPFARNKKRWAPVIGRYTPDEVARRLIVLRDLLPREVDVRKLVAGYPRIMEIPEGELAEYIEKVCLLRPGFSSLNSISLLGLSSVFLPSCLPPVRPSFRKRMALSAICV
jgi:hypothetical protein